MKPKTIYVSYDGVLEPLGYSQIICYLKNLSKNYKITLLSYEKKKDINFKNQRTGNENRQPGRRDQGSEEKIRYQDGKDQVHWR